MRSIRRTLKGPSVLPKTQWNRAVLFRTRFTTIWRSEIHISVKVDADAHKIKMCFNKYDDVDWIHLAKDRYQ